MPRPRSPKKLIGSYSCWACQHEVAVNETPAGTVSAICGWCDFANYARPGSHHRDLLLKQVKPDPSAAPQVPEPADDPAPAPSRSKRDKKDAPPPAPPVKKKSGGLPAWLGGGDD